MSRAGRTGFTNLVDAVRPRCSPPLPKFVSLQCTMLKSRQTTLAKLELLTKRPLMRLEGIYLKTSSESCITPSLAMTPAILLVWITYGLAFALGYLSTRWLLGALT